MLHLRILAKCSPKRDCLIVRCDICLSPDLAIASSRNANSQINSGFGRDVAKCMGSERWENISEKDITTQVVQKSCQIFNHLFIC